MYFSYGGPNLQMVSDSWRGADFGAVMATTYGVVYGIIDGRGSPNKGINMFHSIYRRLGTVEAYDQITVAK